MDAETESSDDGSLFIEDNTSTDVFVAFEDGDLIPAALVDTGFRFVTTAVFNAFSAVALDEYLEAYAGHLLELWSRLEHMHTVYRTDWNRIFSLTGTGHACGGSFLQDQIRYHCLGRSPDQTHPLAIQVFQHDTFDDRQFRRVFTTLLNMFATHAGCFVYHGGSNLQVRSESSRRLCQARFVKEQLLTVRHSIGDPTLTAVQIGQVLYGIQTHWDRFWPHFFPEEYFIGGFDRSRLMPVTSMHERRTVRVQEFLSKCGLPAAVELIVNQAIRNDVGVVFPYEHQRYYTDAHFPPKWRDDAGLWHYRVLRHCLQQWVHQALAELLPYQVQLLGGFPLRLRIDLEELLISPVRLRFKAVDTYHLLTYQISPTSEPPGSDILRYYYIRDQWRLRLIARSIWEHWQ